MMTDTKEAAGQAPPRRGRRAAYRGKSHPFTVSLTDAGHAALGRVLTRSGLPSRIDAIERAIVAADVASERAPWCEQHRAWHHCEGRVGA